MTINRDLTPAIRSIETGIIIRLAAPYVPFYLLACSPRTLKNLLLLGTSIVQPGKKNCSLTVLVMAKAADALKYHDAYNPLWVLVSSAKRS
jgi:hypothetical protein